MSYKYVQEDLLRNYTKDVKYERIIFAIGLHLSAK